MGRASRLARRTGPIDNAGDLERVRHVGAGCIFHLKTDLRVVEAYTAWCTGRELQRLMTVPVSDLFPADRDAAERALIEAICRPPSTAEWDAVAILLRTMGVPCWRWAASTFVTMVFPLAFYTAINPKDGRFLKLNVAGLVKLRRGRVPQDRGSAALQRNVDWWYRARIKEPHDSIHQLERDDTAAHPELSRGPRTVEKDDRTSRSRVYDGIEQVETLLNRLLDEHETRASH